MPLKFYIGAGASIAFIVAAFFLSGAHHEIAYRLRARRRRGYLIGGDR